MSVLKNAPVQIYSEQFVFKNSSGHIWSIRPSLLCQLEKDGAPENGGDTFNMATLRGNMMIWLVVGTPYPSEK